MGEDASLQLIKVASTEKMDLDAPGVQREGNVTLAAWACLV